MGFLSFLARRFGAEQRSVSSSDPYLAEYLGLRGNAASVDASRAGGVPVAYRCIQSKAEAVASVPLRVYRRLPDGGREAVTDIPLARVLGENFNGEITAFEGREALSAWTDLHGNAFARIETNGRGQVTALHPLLPGSTAIERLRSGRLRYRHTDTDGRLVILLAEEVLHIRHRTRDGVTGLSPLTWAREAISLTLDQQEHAGSMMRNGSRFSGALVFQGVAPKQIEDLREWFARHYVGPDKAGKVIVLDGAADFKPFSMSATDAEFLESRKLSNLEIARLYGVPPTIAGIPDHATYSNVTQESRAFVARCLAPWARRIENAANRALLTESQRREFFIEHDLSGLLRGDIDARFEAYRIGREGGWLSANDIRRTENMGPIDGGDGYLQPMNMTDISKGGTDGQTA
jgi:HK97 family phage portal protein